MTLTPEQVSARRSGIGGSDAAAALGLSKFKTARQLYHEKRNEIPVEEPDPELIWWGNALEPIVRQRYAETRGYTVLLPKETLWHPEHSFMCANLDGYVESPRRGYEGKTAWTSIGWGEEGSDQVPSEYNLQVHHYMIVTGLPVFDVACLIGRKIVYYEVAADPELHEMIIAGEREFARRVREGDPPPFDYDHPTTLQLVKRIYPGTNGERVDASPAAIEWRAKMEEATEAERIAKAAKEGYRAHLLAEMGECALLAFPDGKCFRRQLARRASYTVDETSYVDARLVKDPISKGAKK